MENTNIYEQVENEDSKETLATYEVLCDSYKQVHKLKYKLFAFILNHMFSKLGREAGTYMLIKTIQKGK